MITRHIKIDWEKVPGPNFYDPDGRVKDIEDWRVVVKAHLLLQAAQEVSRRESSDPILFDIAQRKCARMIEEKVYGDIRNRLLELRDEIRFGLERHAFGEKDATLKKYDDILALLEPASFTT